MTDLLNVDKESINRIYYITKLLKIILLSYYLLQNANTTLHLIFKTFIYNW